MLDNYRINLKKLSPATTYKFDFALGDDFFNRLDGAETRQGKANVALSVAAASSTFDMTFRINGSVTVTCDRCLDEMEIAIDTINKLIVTFGETYEELTDEHIIIPEDDGTIDVAWHIYEFIALAIPIQNVHEAGGCNKTMAAKLKELCVHEVGEDDDDATEFGAGQTQIDPRWETLRKWNENR